MFTIPNAALVAVMQVGVIVIGILASGVVHRLYAHDGGTMPLPAALVYHYGLFGFSIPLFWIILAMRVRLNPSRSDEVKALTFWFGVLIVIGLVALVLFADAVPILDAF